MWNEGLEPETNTMDWMELTTEQREAAVNIGYTEDLWCETNQPTVAPTKKPTVVLGEAPGNATFAGWFVAPSNNDDNGTATDANGVDQNNLNNDNAEGAETRPAGVDPGYYEEYDWEELPPDVQDAASILGYDEELWDNDGLAWSEDYWWRELTPEAQAAAALLGYDEESWDNEEVHEDAYESVDDDYIFQVSGFADVWVSRYQIIYFFAALSFVFVGVLDLIRERVFFHMLMILAGLFGVASSVYVEEDIHVSNIFNSISVHLFLLEGITLFYDHNRVKISAKAGKWMKRSVKLADFEFALGAFVDVIVSACLEMVRWIFMNFLLSHGHNANLSFHHILSAILLLVVGRHCRLGYSIGRSWCSSINTVAALPPHLHGSLLFWH